MKKKHKNQKSNITIPRIPRILQGMYRMPTHLRILYKAQESDHKTHTKKLIRRIICNRITRKIICHRTTRIIICDTYQDQRLLPTTIIRRIIARIIQGIKE